jgi:hypothetical protein
VTYQSSRKGSRRSFDETPGDFLTTILQASAEASVRGGRRYFQSERHPGAASGVLPALDRS